jgi:outer membrane protein assembly factor BamE (lipoprotein component of BamABCDE complex)
MKISPVCRTLLSISIALLLASCSPIVDTRGHSADVVDVKQIIIGQSSAEDVTALLGSPTTTSNFGDEIWYYITQKQARVGLFAPEVTEQHIIGVQFDTNQKVTDIAEFTKADGKPVQMVSKTTPTEGHSVTFMEQMMGNLGRFNSPGRTGAGAAASSPRNMGR